jgi:hypothetical protein
MDALHVGLPLTTIVPVASQYGRRQREAEMVTGLSAQLRDSGSTGGLAVVIVGARDGRASTQCEVRHGAQALFRVAEISAPSKREVLPGMARAVHPGGYTLRIGGMRKANDENQDLDVPLWISKGYQTVVFVPSGGTRLAGWWLPEASASADGRGLERIHAAILGTEWLPSPLLRLVFRAIELPNTLQLGRQIRRLDVACLHAMLANVSVGKDLPTIRVLDHVRFLLETGDVDTARRILQGRRAEETAGAILLSVASVRKVLDKANRELRRTVDAEQGRARTSTETRLPGRNFWARSRKVHHPAERKARITASADVKVMTSLVRPFTDPQFPDA